MNVKCYLCKKKYKVEDTLPISIFNYICFNCLRVCVCKKPQPVENGMMRWIKNVFKHR